MLPNIRLCWFTAGTNTINTSRVLAKWFKSSRNIKWKQQLKLLRREYLDGSSSQLASNQKFQRKLPYQLRRLRRLKATFYPDLPDHKAWRHFDIDRTKGKFYAVYNVVNHRVYVGQTKNSVFKRWQQHVNSAQRFKRGVNSKSDGTYFHRQMVKVGIHYFHLVVLEEIVGQYDN